MRLFTAISSDQYHILYQNYVPYNPSYWLLTPPNIPTVSLPNKDDCNFIPRVLYKNIYWIASLNYNNNGLANNEIKKNRKNASIAAIKINSFWSAPLVSTANIASHIKSIMDCLCRCRVYGSDQQSGERPKHVQHKWGQKTWSPWCWKLVDSLRHSSGGDYYLRAWLAWDNQQDCRKILNSMINGVGHYIIVSVTCYKWEFSAAG